MIESAVYWAGAGRPAAPTPSGGDDRVRAIRERCLRILVIDDEEEYREAVVLDLERRYAAVVQPAESGEDGLRHMTELTYDVVIVDFGLDGINGIEVCRRMIESGYASRLILVSARQDSKVAAAASQLGVDYFDKPMDDELFGSILFSVAKGQTDE